MSFTGLTKNVPAFGILGALKLRFALIQIIGTGIKAGNINCQI